MVQETFNFIANYISILMRYYTELSPFINLVSPVLSVLASHWVYRKNTIKINKEAEKIKYEMQRKYLYLQIKTKNLLEIYPKLYRIIREAGKIIIFFDNLEKEKPKLLKSTNLKDAFNLYIYNFFNGDNSYGLKDINQFADYCEESSLFLSDKVNEQAQKMKQDLIELYRLFKKISSEDYNKNEFIQLTDQANIIIIRLNQCRTDIKNQMKSELEA